MGIIARCIKYAAEKLVTLTGETIRDFNVNALLYTPAGDDSIPLPDERLLLVKVGGAGKYVTAGVLTPSQGAKPGEKILFARDGDGNVVSKLSFLKDGTVKLEAEKDFIKKIKGEAKTDIDKDLTVTVKGDITLTGNGNIVHETTGNFTIKGATVKITGKTEIVLETIGAATWCPNGVPNCFITGGPHGGPAMGIIGLKGG